MPGRCSIGESTGVAKPPLISFFGFMSVILALVWAAFLGFVMVLALQRGWLIHRVPGHQYPKDRAAPITCLLPLTVSRWGRGRSCS